MMKLCPLLLLAASVVLCGCSGEHSSEHGKGSGKNSPEKSLTIYLMFSSGEQRTIFSDVIRRFADAHPELAINSVEFEQETYKRDIAALLKDSSKGIDVFFWFGGLKLQRFSAEGLISPVDDLWSESLRGSFTAASEESVMFGGRHYGVPLSYYQWGFYYNRKLFERYGIDEPKDWPSLLKACRILKSNGITPFVIGAKDGWPAAGWFDYLDLRLNGLEFHRRLMRGEIPYTHPSVRNVFLVWRSLIKEGFIYPDAIDLSWRDALPYIYWEKAAMNLMGNFIIAQVPKKMRPQIGFFRFPVIDEKNGRFEEAPIDVLLISSRAKNPESAKEFLRFISGADVLADINDKMGMISPNRRSKAADDPFIREGMAVLERADGISQFYDRDTLPAMSEAGMQGIKSFLQNPDSIDSILDTLEAKRREVFGPAK